MDALKLINTPFPLEFAGETYQVRKATLEKIILFQNRFSQLSEEKDAAIQAKVAAYCLYLVLKDVKPEITEEWVLQNTPNVEFADVLEQLGFMSRQKVDILRKALGNAPTQSEQAGT